MNVNKSRKLDHALPLLTSFPFLLYRSYKKAYIVIHGPLSGPKKDRLPYL